MSTLGLDRSGNGNDWIAVNITIDNQVVDSPTNNFATLDPTWQAYFTDNYGYSLISEGNLRADSVGNVNKIHMHKSTFRMVGKVYFEAIAVTQYYQIAGFGTFNWVGSSGVNDGAGNAAEGANLYVNDGDEVFSYRQGGSQVDSSANFATINANDVMQFAYDEDSGKGWVGINNTWYAADAGNDGDPAAGNNPTVTITAANRGDIFPGGSDWASGNSTASGLIYNFGQDSSFAGKKTAQGNQDGGGIGDFYYTPPTGFKAMCTSNLPDVDVTPSKHFNTILYTGDGTSNRDITGTGFNPDLNWLKMRSGADNHVVTDVLRGTNHLHPNANSADSDISYPALVTDGFRVSSGTYNNDTYTFVAWQWKANGSGSQNTSGTINTTATSANVDAGFSISTYTGTGSNATIGHGLSTAPEMVICKRRNSTEGWAIYHSGIASDAETDFIELHSTGAASDSNTRWNDTAPTSSVFSIGTHDSVNASSSTYVAYAFHSVDGYSKVGSYTGNGNADGTFVYTGFRPAWLLVRRTDGSADWLLFDAARNTFNVVDKFLEPNTGDAEATESTSGYEIDFDFTSNGFKLRGPGGGINSNGANYIYMAFAETPFKYSNAR